jgi:hypothetical protein
MGKDPFQMYVAVVLAGSVVFVIGPERSQVFQPFPDILVKSRFVVVDNDSRRYVHGL